MKRREFLAIAGLSPIFFKLGCSSNDLLRYTPDSKTSLEMLEVSGSYNEIGLQIGKHFQKNIVDIISNRAEWITKLKKVVDSDKGRKYSDDLYNNAVLHFPQLIKELKGIAEGSEVDFDLIWIMTISAELGSMDVPGCSTVYYKDNENQWLFHNEDSDKAYYGRSYILKAHPPSGVSFYSLCYPGMLAGIGQSFNDKGIVHTANYIGTTNPQIGIPRTFLGRAALESKTIEETISIVTKMPRAVPWHHNIGSTKTKEYISVETLPDGIFEVYKPTDILYTHTNHLIHNKTNTYNFKEIKNSEDETVVRYDTFNEEFKKNNNEPISNPNKILKWMSSHKNTPKAICRHPEGENTVQTQATALIDFNSNVFRIYKGNPCIAVPNRLYEDYRF